MTWLLNRRGPRFLAFMVPSFLERHIQYLAILVVMTESWDDTTSNKRFSKVEDITDAELEQYLDDA